ncbi:EGF receptor activation regulator Star [Arctopsyche grandis]|uniref:EGF receptor activation regulator Star n=1 Tax=Arctopsyche grandis TaxID=121162 RepID=UPI00406D9945
MVRAASALVAKLHRLLWRQLAETTPLPPPTAAPPHPPPTPPAPSPLTRTQTAQLKDGAPPCKGERSPPSASASATVASVESAVPPEEPFRHFLPAALFILTFVTVIGTLLIYMDNTVIQFKQNMRREDELAKVAQDDDVLVAYIREWQLTSAAKPFPPHSRHPSLPPERLPPFPTPIESVVAQLLNYKHKGVFVEVGAYGAASGGGSRTEWLESTLEWSGLLLTPNAHDYFRLRARRTAPGTLTTHACLSTSTHPKEITYQENWPREEVEVGVLALGNAGEEFSARVKCFPLYSLLLAAQKRNVDFLSLSCGGCELAALLSLPQNDQVHISIVEIVGKQSAGAEALLLSRGYNIVTKTSTSTIYAVRDIPTLKI